MTRHARIVGTVEYREGDGPTIAIRPGPVDFQETELDVTLGWMDEDASGDATTGSTAMPIADFKRYVAKGAIVLSDAS